MTYWEFRGRELVNCNCEYGCNCQFNALPDKGHCQAVAGIQIDEGHHGDTRLDGLKIAAIYKWPGAVHEGNGEALPFVDQRADERQREALLRIMTGEDTDPFATMLAVFGEMEAAGMSARSTAARNHMIATGRTVGGRKPWPYATVPAANGPPPLLS